MRNALIAIALLAITALGSFFFGEHVATLNGDLKDTKQLVQALQKLDEASQRVRELERAAQLMVDARAEQLKKEKADAKTERDNFIAGVRNGTIRVSIPVAGSGNTDSANSAAAGGNGGEKRAELDPAAAATLEAIAGDGDDAIRQLNTCIDTYNDIRRKYNVQTK